MQIIADLQLHSKYSRAVSQKNRKVFFEKALAFLLILLLPTQFGKHFFFDFSYIDGVRVDYLSLILYLTDLVSLILFTFHWELLIEFVKTYKKQFLVLSVLLFSNALVSQFPVLALYQILRILQLIALFIIFSKTTLSKNQIVTGFLLGGIVELVLSVLQLYKKSSLQGPFYFLGERLMNLSTASVAKASLGGTQFLRPYATFSHPNSMAGFYLLIYTFFLFSKQANQNRIYTYLRTGMLITSSLIVFLTFSKTAVFVFLLVNMWYLLKNGLTCKFCTTSRIIAALAAAGYIFIAQTDPLSLQKRVFLISNSLHILTKNLLFGTGLGHYIISQSHISNPYPYSFFQPVHNIVLLFFCESGLLLGTVLLYYVGVFIKNHFSNKTFTMCLLIILATGMLDHYWLTLQQNWLLLPLILAIASRKKF